MELSIAIVFVGILRFMKVNSNPINKTIDDKDISWRVGFASSESVSFHFMASQLRPLR